MQKVTQTAVTVAGVWEATSGLLYSGPLTPQLERLPSGWNLMSMELTPFEPQALDIFSIVTVEQVMLDHENRRQSCVQEKIDLTINSRLARVIFPLSNGCVCVLVRLTSHIAAGTSDGAHSHYRQPRTTMISMWFKTLVLIGPLAGRRLIF